MHASHIRLRARRGSDQVWPPVSNRINRDGLRGVLKIICRGSTVHVRLYKQHQGRRVSVFGMLGWKQIWTATFHSSCHKRASGEAAGPCEVSAWQW